MAAGFCAVVERRRWVLVIAARPHIESGGDLVLRDIRTTVEPVGQVSCAGCHLRRRSLRACCGLSCIGGAVAGTGGAGSARSGAVARADRAGRPRPLQLATSVRVWMHPSALVLAPAERGGRGTLRISVIGLDVEPRKPGYCPKEQSPPPKSLMRQEAPLGKSLRRRAAVAVLTQDPDKPALGPQLGGNHRQRRSRCSCKGRGRDAPNGAAAAGCRGDLPRGAVFRGHPQLPAVRAGDRSCMCRICKWRQSPACGWSGSKSACELIEGNLADRAPHCSWMSQTSSAGSKALPGTLKVQGGSWQNVAQQVGVSQVALQTDLVQGGAAARGGVASGVVVAYVLLRGRARRLIFR